MKLKYDATNLKRFRKFYLCFQKGATLSHLSWSQVVEFFPIKEENKRNYYINLCIAKNLSVKKLKKEIKNNSYERLRKRRKIKNEHNLETTILAKL